MRKTVDNQNLKIIIHVALYFEYIIITKYDKRFYYYMIIIMTAFDNVLNHEFVTDHKNQF